MFEFIPDINDVFKFNWADYGYKNNTDLGKIYGSLVGKFKIGQGVIVVSDMNFYSTYTPMLDAMIKKLEINELKKLMRNELNNGECGIIIGRKYHEKKNDLLYGIRMNDDKIAIISEKGLKINKNYTELLDDKLFEI